MCEKYRIQSGADVEAALATFARTQESTDFVVSNDQREELKFPLVVSVIANPLEVRYQSSTEDKNPGDDDIAIVTGVAAFVLLPLWILSPGESPQAYVFRVRYI